MTKIDFGFDLGINDFEFLDEMTCGGISDDLTPRSGDISFDDNTNYADIPSNETSEEVNEILNIINSI